jgi:hypothetical protein
MRFRDAVARACRLMISPDAEWRTIAADLPSSGAVLGAHLIPLCVLLAVAWTAGVMLFPMQSAAGTRAAPMFALTVLLCVAASAVQAGAMGMLLPMYDRPRQWRRALIVAGYGATPVLLTGILLVYPTLVIASVLALPFALYQHYLGAQHVLGVARGEAAEFVAASALISLGGSVALGAAMASIKLI